MAFGVAAAVLTAALLSASSSALADKGVSVDLGKIEVDKPLSKGGTYQLPTMGVRNPGTESANYVMAVSYIEAQKDRRAPAGWLQFSPDEFHLEPGQTQPVAITLRVPTSASPDDYAALLSAQLAEEGEGARVGAAAGARLEFSVEPSNILEAWRLRLRTMLADYGPWSYLAPLLALALLATYWFSRRFSFRMERRR